MRSAIRSSGSTGLLLGVVLATLALPAQATITGITGTNFTLVAKADYISTPDGNSLLTWGYANGAGGNMQYPGPTLIVNQGATVTVTLLNQLSVPTSILFPGQKGVFVSGGSAGPLTREAPPDGTTPVTYSFVASDPGTYTYYSGTQTDLQVEMGLIGALIIRPTGFDPTPPDPVSVTPNPNRRAYNHAGSTYDREYLFFLSEMDPDLHQIVEFDGPAKADMTTRFANNWFINGRCGPDTMGDAADPFLPNQPYNCMPRMHPGEKVLLRLIGGGRDLHPFHHHGNNTWTIARDGRMLESVPGSSGPDVAVSDFTITVAPGQTYDAIYTWTGEKLGWDAYGHQQDIDNAPAGWASGGAKGPEDLDWNGNGVFDSVPMAPGEYAPDHGKPLPTVIPSIEVLTFGQMASGSPFLGGSGQMPPGEGGMNMTGAFFYMWHSHNEKEIVNNNVFPGGMLTMAAVEPPGVPIP